MTLKGFCIFLFIKVAHMVTRFVCFFLAIHQKLEADGTEKVEGSMTQKLENVLNSKFALLPETMNGLYSQV